MDGLTDKSKKGEHQMKQLKKSKKGIITFATIAFVTLFLSQAFAQGRGYGRGYGYGDRPGRADRGNFHRGIGPGMGHEFRHLDMLKIELGLSNSQVQKIFDIGTKYRILFFKNRGNYNKTIELLTQKKKDIEAVLTKEQRTRLNTLFQNRRGDRRHRRHRGRMGY